MAPKVSHLLSFFLSSLLLFLFLFLSQATSSGPSAVRPTGHLESFGSFKYLEGSRKGDKIEGIQKVKQYLQRYGYLKLNPADSPQYSDNFDDSLESSLKAFQSFYHLAPTGMLDEATAALMSKPRCGFPDHPVANNYNNDSNDNMTIHPDYEFWIGVKWPLDKMNIHYIVFPDGHPEEPITMGFDAWAAVTNFTFERVREESFAEVRVYFIVMKEPLGSALAYPNASIRFNSEVCWVDGAVPDCIDLRSVATHEMGHVLGLGHSQDERAAMSAYIGTNQTKPITQDDIDGIRARYSS